jgi:hypothetical protein
MNEQHKHTEFLKHCLRYDDSSQRHQMMEQLNRLQRDLYIVQRASWLVGVLIVLSLAILIYPVILIQNFPYNVQRFFTDMVFALLLGLLVSLIAFVVLHVIFRRKLHHQRDACRQFLMRLLASRLGPTP